jgi:hypothetical protein
MAKIRRNSHKTRAKRNKAKARAQRFRSRNQVNKYDIWYNNATKPERAESDIIASQAMVSAFGTALGIDSKEIELDLLTLRSEILADYDLTLNDLQMTKKTDSSRSRARDLVK